MRVKEGVAKVKGVAVGFGRFLRRRKRAAVALLVIAPLLLTGDVEIFALNLVGLGFGALLLRRFTRYRDGNQAAQAQRTAETTTQRRTR